jgi:hypothetical protein
MLVQSLTFSVLSRGIPSFGIGAPLFFICFEFVALLLIRPTDLEHWRLLSSNPMDVNKRSKRLAGELAGVGSPFLNFFIVESAKNMHERPRLTTQGSAEGNLGKSENTS